MNDKTPTKSERAKKYELLHTDVQRDGGVVLHRVRALITFNTPQGEILAGELGGYIEKESNLSHEGACWVHSGATVKGKAVVRDDAQVKAFTRVSGSAVVSNKSVVAGNALIYDEAQISGSAHISGWSHIRDKARVGGEARVYGHVCVQCNADIAGDVHISGNSTIGRDALIRCSMDILHLHSASPNDCVTFYLATNKRLLVSVGLFNGSPDDVLKNAHTNSYREMFGHLIHAAEFSIGLRK